MRTLTIISRIFVGLLFIFSGFIKANDTVGFSYKLVEYFEVFNMHFLVSLALPLAMFICIFEIVVGFTLLMGSRIKLTLWLLLLMILFFTFLTFYSAYFNKVTSCGCFGDAIPLTPWQSFIKDLVLLVFIIILFIGKKYLTPIFKGKVESVLIIVVIIASTSFPLYTYNYLPIIDFRPYKIGTDLYAAINPQMKYYYILKNKKTGEQKEFESWPENWDTDYDYIDNRTEPLDKNVKPIIGYTMNNEYGENYTNEFLQKEGFKFLLVEYDLEKANVDVQGKINDFASVCEINHIEFAGLTSADSLKTAEFKKEHNISYPFYLNPDDVPLKTMIRSNPGLILLNGSKVIEMWHYHTFPSFTDVKEKYFKE